MVLILYEMRDKPRLGPKGEPGPTGKGDGDHFDNFVKAVLARDPKMLHAEIQEGHRSSALCHLGNIAYRTGRALNFDNDSETFAGDPQANALLTREYRSPFTMPEKV